MPCISWKTFLSDVNAGTLNLDGFVISKDYFFPKLLIVTSPFLKINDLPSASSKACTTASRAYREEPGVEIQL